MKALDLFCGAGGLSVGFSKAGFQVIGVDCSEAAKETFELNKIGRFVKADLSTESVRGRYQIILGGPPCKPWATINTTLRSSRHPDYDLLGRFFDHVIDLRPKMFLMENVPSLGSKLILKRQLKRVRDVGYDFALRSVKYSEFGAPTVRRRLIIFGLKRDRRRKDVPVNPAEIFFEKLSLRKTKPCTVEKAISYLRDKRKGEAPDHVWPQLTTIDKYRQLGYYDKGKYGWYVLKWNKPAHSFGNISKTYVLHPDSFNGGITRVISVREAWRIMGFPRNFILPSNRGMETRYQLAVDAVSPKFSFRVAKVVKEILAGGCKG
jgi:DNA (cytosine-5)-methyltransferase 1